LLIIASPMPQKLPAELFPRPTTGDNYPSPRSFGARVQEATRGKSGRGYILVIDDHAELCRLVSS